MTDGLLSIRHRETKGAGEGEDIVKQAAAAAQREVRPGDLVVERQKKKKLNDVDLLLRKFRYRESVEAALLSRDPVIFVSLLSDLLHRNVLRNSLAGRDADALVPLLKMVCKYVAHPRYSMTLLHTSNVLVDIYAPMLGQSSQVDYLFCQLAAKLKKEITLQENMMSLLGSVDFVVHSSQVGSSSSSSSSSSASSSTSPSSGPVER
jgi:U3 small nucleolar RNA-associated protein 15